MRPRPLLNLIRKSTHRERPRQRPRRFGESLRCEPLETRTMLTGFWTSVTNPTPTGGSGTMLLLSDGTVMAMGGLFSFQWNQLSPDSTGHYDSGTWTPMPPMNVTREHFPANVLPDGRVFVLGGEYSSIGGDTNAGEIYNPVTKSWTTIPNFPGPNFGDDPTMVLPDGRVLAGDITGPQTYIYNPASNTWSPGGTKLRGDQSDEESWVKLADGSILTYEIFTQGATTAHAQRYIPSTNTWVDAGTVPVLLSSGALGSELGPGLLLPDGRAFYVGATGHTAYYTPSTNTWAAGPDLPNGLGSDDEPGAVLPNGDLLIAAEVPVWNPPTHLLELNPATGIYTDVTPQGYNMKFKGFHFKMLMLPTGQVLFDNGTSQLEIYTPDGAPQSSWRPAITNISEPSNGTFTLTGTQINGLSAGAAFGDDAEMDSNYPIVRLTSETSPNVYYARTFNWSNTGVATGNTPETVNFTLPPGLTPGSYALNVVGSGIASPPVLFVLGTNGNDTITYKAVNINSHEVSQVSLNGSSQNFVMDGFAGVYICGGTGNDTINVQTTFTNLPVTVGGGTGNDTVNISSAANNLNTIQGTVSVQGGGGSETLNVRDQAEAAAVAYTVGTPGTSTSALTRSGAAAVSYDSSVTAVNLYGGSGADAYDVDGTLAGGVTTIQGGPAHNAFTISSTADDLNTIQGSINIHGGGGNDSLTVDDQASAGPVTYTLTEGTSESTLVRTGAAAVSYDSSVQTVVLNGGTGSDTYNVNSTRAGVGTTLNGGPAGDTFNISPAAETLDTIQGSINIHGGGGSDALNVDDQADAAPVTYTMETAGTSESTLIRTGAAAVSYDSSVTAMTLNGGTSNDTYDVLGTPAGTMVSLNGGAGSNTLVGPNGNNAWDITGSNAGTLQGPAPSSPVTFTGMPNLTGGSLNDTFQFTAAGSVSGMVDGGAGTNTLDYSGDGGIPVTVNLAADTATLTGGFAHIEDLVGSPSTADLLIGPNSTNTWLIAGANSGQVGSLGFSGIENLIGGSGLNAFVFEPGGTISGTIDGGGGGNDWLDYAALKTPVSVDLTAKTATGVAGGIADIRNVRGGQGGNTLTGNAQGNILIGGILANTLTGGTGPSILIGGAGADQITGNSGGDILIAGYTDYDSSSTAHDLALESILAEWQSANSYAARISHITNGGGLNGSNTLVWGVNVHDNSTANANTLTGGGGEGALNWFFANLTHTKTNRTPAEQLN